MARELLFKAKRKDNGEWVEGYLLKKYYQELPHDRFAIQYKTTGDEHEWTPKYMAVEIDENTLCQYTGLTDNNENKIFEGDILSTENGTFSNTGMGHILFYKGMWTSFYGQDAIDRDCYDELHTVCSAREVIGNIFDNPELLGGGE